MGALAREDRRAVNLESLSLRRDRTHFAEECALLQQMAGDEEKTLDVVQKANQYLEKSYYELDAQTGLLEQQRRELLQQVTKEKELVRVEERQSAELRNTLERMKREHITIVAERREANRREQQIIEMQTDGQQVHSQTDRRPREALQKQGHSWASVLAGSGFDNKSDKMQNQIASVP